MKKAYTRIVRGSVRAIANVRSPARTLYIPGGYNLSTIISNVPSMVIVAPVLDVTHVRGLGPRGQEGPALS